MPELPDITVYVEALEKRVLGQKLEGLRLKSLFLLRTFEPKPAEVVGRTVREITRLGKRIVFELEDELFLVLHLMIAGRLQWKDKPRAALSGIGQAAFDFADGTLLFTEAGSKHRASLHILRGRVELAAFDRGGLEPMTADRAAFVAALTAENRTLKRVLTDPAIISGVGNAYSDEILHRAKLSPITWTTRLDENEATRLFKATQAVLNEWTERLRAEVADAWPKKVTAFREEMAVHGRFGLPCPVCQTPVQRIVYASNETNYCPICQTEGRLLADRALSKLLKGDWPKTLEELEERKRR